MKKQLLSFLMPLTIAFVLPFWFMTLSIYAFIFWLINTIYFIALEEPGLEKRFGASYRKYKKVVPMWLLRLSPYKG